MTLSDLYRKVKGICACLNSAGVPLKCNGNDFNVDFEIKSKDAIVSHIEVKQDLALTWEDINAILMLSYNLDYEQMYKDIPFNEEEHCREVLNRFNEQRKK